MNWEAIGAIGQLLGSVAVFVTLVYLAGQIRHAREEVQRNLGKVSIDSAQEILLAQATHPSLNGIYVKARANLGFPPLGVIQVFIERAGLTEEEARVLHSHQLAWWQHRLQVIPHLDTMLPSQRASFENATRSYFAQPMMRMWYDEFKLGRSHPEAFRYIDNLLAQPG
jgi:hypothetical protein